MAPGIWSPSGDGSVNCASVQAKSASRVQMSLIAQKLLNSTPQRSLAPLGSVVPASPTKRSSESSSRYQSASDVFQRGRQAVRRPSSAPLDRTSGSTGSTGSPLTGSKLTQGVVSSIEAPNRRLCWQRGNAVVPCAGWHAALRCPKGPNCCLSVECLEPAGVRCLRSCDTRSHAYLSRKLRSGVLPPVPYRAVRWG